MSLTDSERIDILEEVLEKMNECAHVGLTVTLLTPPRLSVWVHSA